MTSVAAPSARARPGLVPRTWAFVKRHSLTVYALLAMPLVGLLTWVFARLVLPVSRLVQQLKAEPKGAYIEIEGHTDSAGTPDTNYKLGLERAENVKRYLYEQHQVRLHRINIISYGEDKPIAPNKTRDGRAQNRRVVIKVLT